MKKLFTLLLILVSLQAFCVKVTFKVDMTGQDTTQGVYVTGHLMQNETLNWDIKPMKSEGNNIFTWDTVWTPGPDSLAYYFLTTPIWDNYLDYREYLEDGEGNPLPCAIMWGSDRLIVVPAKDTIIRNIWASCETWEPTSIKAYETGKVRIDLYPNPANGDVTLLIPESKGLISIDVIDISGKIVNVNESFVSATEVRLRTNELTKGVYFIKVYNKEFSIIRKLIIN